MNEKIDFVITWVDGNDPEWVKEKDKYSEKNIRYDNRSNRYRNWDNLKYWFRGVEKYAPWVNKIYFVTCGQKPEWLNENNEKLVLINHEDYIPKEYLPTFNSNVIEINFHRIKELSENFVLFNDDTFIINKTNPTDFFKNGLPCDTALLTAIVAYDKDNFSKVQIANMGIINSYFKKEIVINKNIFKWFNIKYGVNVFRNIILMPFHHIPGIYDLHLPCSCKKSVIKKIWELEPEIMEETSKSRFRDNNTNINQWLFRYWNICEGNFMPRSIKFGKKFQYEENNEKMYKAIRQQKYKTICLNDTDLNYDFEKEKEETINCLESIFPEKSSFEK